MFLTWSTEPIDDHMENLNRQTEYIIRTAKRLHYECDLSEICCES